MHIGFVMYEGPSLIGDGDVAAIATLSSKNDKTGNMVQVWIVPRHTGTLEAVQQGNNSAACGNCPLMGQPAKRDVRRRNGAIETVVQLKNRVCYVNLGRLDSTVVAAYHRGRYSPYIRRLHERWLRNRDIRLGAYGDPAALPTHLVEYLATVGSGHTGYSHQLFWIERERADTLSQWLMASCHTKAQHTEAVRRGWRPFTVISEGATPPAGAIECPHYTRGVSCEQCQLCQGTSKQAKPIYVIAHAKVGLNLPHVLSSERIAING